MPLTVPLALRLEASKLVSTRPWLLFLELTLLDDSVLYFVRNTDDVEFQSHTWTAFSFALGVRNESGDGAVQSVTLRVANAARGLTYYLESQSGLVGAQVRIMVVHEDHLDENYTELTLTYSIIATAIPPNEPWVEFTLGAENPIRRRFPPYAAIPLHCNWVARFKGAECGYAGEDATCTGSLSACRAKNNSARFGGFPAITGAVRFV